MFLIFFISFDLLFVFLYAIIRKLIQKVTKKDEDIVIVPDENTFSLIVYASRKNQEWVRKLIKTLDKRRPQVLIDVSLVEITREDLFDYDLNLIANANRMHTAVVPGHN